MLLQRAGSWALGKAIPDSRYIRPLLHAALLCITTGIAGAVFLCTSLGLFLAGFYHFLIEQQYPASSAYGIIGAITLLLSAIGFMVARRAVQRASLIATIMQADEKPTIIDTLSNTARDLLTSFSQGFNEAPPPSEKKNTAETTPKTPPTHEANATSERTRVFRLHRPYAPRHSTH